MSDFSAKLNILNLTTCKQKTFATEGPQVVKLDIPWKSHYSIATNEAKVITKYINSYKPGKSGRTTFFQKLQGKIKKKYQR